MDDALNGRVECHSGYAYAERPLALYWKGSRLEIETVEATRRTPAGKQFRVHTRDQQVFELTYLEATDQWHIIRL